MSRTWTLLAAAVLPACVEDDPKPACQPAWETLLEDDDPDDDDLGTAILSVWGDSADDLWFAGGTLGIEPSRAIGLHFDGATWTDLALGVTPSLWWVTRTPEGTTWFAGEEGLVVRYSDGEVTTFENLADATLFGIWGSSDSDVWAVGGAVSGGDRDVILHFDGADWTVVAPPEAFDVQLFKVWGCAADDVWIVGGDGVILHWDGSAWTSQVFESEGGGRPQLFTVNGRSCDDVWAVGSSTTILHWDGSAWTQYVDPTGEEIFAGMLNGVWAPAGGDVCVVGLGGVKLWIPDEGPHVEHTLEGTGSDLHGVWCDAGGTAFAVGGNFFAPDPAAREGTIAHRGCPAPMDGLPIYTPGY